MSSTNVITDSVNMNYMYTALMIALTSDPSLLRNGISNETPIVHSCDHTGWESFKNDGMRYIFFINFKIQDFILGTLESLANGEIINQGAFKHNYDYSLMKTVEGKRVPVTYNDILNDPISATQMSHQSFEEGVAGIPLATYVRQNIQASQRNIGLAPVDVRNIQYNQPFYYETRYTFTTTGGQTTVKRAMIGVIKYKKANGEDYVAFVGTPINELLVE